jgi:hypothetical protein
MQVGQRGLLIPVLLALVLMVVVVLLLMHPHLQCCHPAALAVEHQQSPVEQEVRIMKGAQGVWPQLMRGPPVWVVQELLMPPRLQAWPVQAHLIGPVMEVLALLPAEVRE